MEQLPKVIVSSVIRSAHQGESHGGVYIVDLQAGQFTQVIDWNDPSISWEGRGLDRGLRGIAIHDDAIYMAASDEIFAYDRQFNLLASFRNLYLKHCHEIFVSNGILYLASTGFDSILLFDLRSTSFIRGYCFRYASAQDKYLFGQFDPCTSAGPVPGDSVHINNVYVKSGVIYFSGLRISSLMQIQDSVLKPYAPLPLKTHNAHPYGRGALLNDTAADRISYLDMRGSIIESFGIKRYPNEQLLMSELPQDHARQAFGRGLRSFGERWIVGGSSPATVSVYQFGEPEAIRTINFSMDVRNAIHGLEIWPFD